MRISHRKLTSLPLRWTLNKQRCPGEGTPNVARKITIRVIQELSCPEGPVCPLQAVVDQDPDNTYFVYKTDIDPDIAAAFAGRIGPGEALGKVPNQIAGR